MGAVAAEILDLRPLVEMHVEIRALHPLPSQVLQMFFHRFVGFLWNCRLFSVCTIEIPGPHQ